MTRNLTKKPIIEHLKKYEEIAIRFGASDAKRISAREMRIEERVRNKCQVPRCMEFNTNANCPPFTVNAAQMREVVSGYTWGVSVKVDVEPSIIAGDAISTCLMKETFDKGGQILKLGRHYKRIFKIVSEVEAAAFYDGFYLAVGFSAGSCKGVFCFRNKCQALLPGQRCRFPLIARPSLEAVGFDVFHLAKHVGWKIHPIGSRTKSAEIGSGILVGLVLIG